jgi:hypothetical protein
VIAPVGTLLGLSMSTLAASEAVQVERLRLAGAAISAVSSTIAAALIYRNGRDTRRRRRRRRGED